MTTNEGEKWDGTISKLRISDTVYPELYKDLLNVPQRERGERLRILAYLALQTLKMGSVAPPEASNPSSQRQGEAKVDDPAGEADAKIKDATKARRDRLLGGLN